MNKYLLIVILLVLVGASLKVTIKRKNFIEDVAENPIATRDLLAKAAPMIANVCEKPDVVAALKSTKLECESRISEFSEICIDRIVGSYPDSINNPHQAKEIVERYAKCVVPQ